MISVRDLVLFPGGVRPIMAGREFTIASLKTAIGKHDGSIILTTQKFIELNDRPSLDQIYQLGTLCKIIKSVDFPDGSMKVALLATSKFYVSEIVEADDIRYGKGEQVDARENQNMISADERIAILEKLKTLEIERLQDLTPAINNLNKAKDDFTFLMGVGNILSLRPNLQRQLTLEQIREGIFFVDTLTSEEQQTINLGTARMQEILESKNTATALKKLKALI